MMYQETNQYLNQEEQEALQYRGLMETLTYVNSFSPYYRELFGKHKIQINRMKSIKDLTHIPTTGKEQIQLQNDQFLCVPPNRIIEYAATSGTLGSPVYIALTHNDLDRLAYNEFLSFQLMKINAGDTVQLMLTLDRQFMAGLAYYMGLRQTGASIIRTGPGMTSLQVETAQKLKTTAVVAVPSFLLKIIDYCHEADIDLSALNISKVLCIGENIRNEQFELNALASKILSAWNLKLYSTYASTEMQTAFTECGHGSGGHHQPDLIIVEILDNEGNVLKEGEYGEVTITNLGVEGMPLLRYRTGDICCFYKTPCLCGRTTMRLSPVAGRKNQMVKYKGTTFYPPVLFELLNQHSHIQDYVIEVSHDEFKNDLLTIHISSSINISECEAILLPLLQARLRIKPILNFCSPDEIFRKQYPGDNRKPFKFIDNRS